MPEVPIDDLLRALDESVEPAPAFAARLRTEVARVLTGEGPEVPAARREIDDEEVVAVDVTSSEAIVGPRRPYRVLAAAAAVVLVALVGSVLVIGGDEEAREVTSADSSLDFAGGEPELVATIAGANPYYVASTSSHVWALTLGGRLQRLDPETGEVLETTQVSESSPMVATDDALWIGDAVSGEVTRIDHQTLEVVARVDTGIAVELLQTRGVGLAHDMGGRRSFSLVGGIDAAGDSVWVGDRGGRLLHIDAATNEVTRTIDVDIRPDIVRIDGDHVLIGDYAARTVQVRRADDGEVVARFGPVEKLMGADLHAGAAYVQDATTGVVTRIVLATGEELQSAPLGASWINTGIPVYAPGVRVSAAGVLAETDDQLVVLDPTTLERRGSFELEGNGGELLIDADGTAWIVRYTTNEILRLTPKS